MRESCRRGGPPWWAAGGDVPRHHRPFHADARARALFFRRLVVAGVAVVLLTLTAMLAAGWLLAGRLGLTGWNAVLPAITALAVTVAVMTAAFGAMRRFGSSLGAVMEAADRVADGDYTVRVEELGPPPIRALARSFNTMTGRLQDADRLRRDLMADVAHELRTPLSVLQGRLEGVLDGVYSRDDLQISQLLEETQVLSRLIDDLRTLALSEAGALKLQLEPTEIVGLVQDVARSMEADAARRGIAVEVKSDVGPTVIDLDPIRIREVLLNLLSNALRHTSRGSVELSITSAGETIRIAVADTGVGMSAEAVARVFDRFYTGDSSRGSGLGLAIARAIVVAHGGSITASSVEGRGTTITFSVPAG